MAPFDPPDPFDRHPDDDRGADGDTDRILAVMTAFQETVMATLADLQAAVQTLIDNDAAIASQTGAVLAALTDLETVVTTLRSTGSLSPADQAVLDTATASVTAAAADLGARAASLGSAAAAGEAVVTPPAPAAAPADPAADPGAAPADPTADPTAAPADPAASAP